MHTLYINIYIYIIHPHNERTHTYIMFAVRRSSAALLSRASCATVSRRALSSSAARHNLIQDLYLKELKGAKIDMATLQSPESIAENVIAFSAPVTPKAPGLEAAQKENLTDYINESVETTLDKAADAAAVKQDPEQDEDWLVIEDEPEEAHH